jgi:hypothetical protein
MTGGEGGHTAVPQFRESIGYTRATISRKHVLYTFKAEQLKKSLPRTPSDFTHQALVYKGLLEQGLKFGENFSPPKKTAKKQRRKIVKIFFHH